MNYNTRTGNKLLPKLIRNFGDRESQDFCAEISFVVIRLQDNDFFLCLVSLTKFYCLDCFFYVMCANNICSVQQTDCMQNCRSI